MKEWVELHFVDDNKPVMVRTDKIIRFGEDGFTENYRYCPCTKISTVDDNWIRVAELFDEVKEMICQEN